MMGYMAVKDRSYLIHEVIQSQTSPSSLEDGQVVTREFNANCFLVDSTYMCFFKFPVTPTKK